jgi:hypothetical protein
MQEDRVNNNNPLNKEDAVYLPVINTSVRRCRSPFIAPFIIVTTWAWRWGPAAFKAWFVFHNARRVSIASHSTLHRDMGDRMQKTSQESLLTFETAIFRLEVHSV